MIQMNSKDPDDNDNNDEDRQLENSIFLLSLISFYLQNYGAARINYDAYLKGIREIEEETGSLSLVWNIQRLPSPHNKRMLNYFIERIFEDMSLGAQDMGLHDLRKTTNESDINNKGVNSETSGQFNFVNTIKSFFSDLAYNQLKNDKRIIERYILTWENLFVNFVLPIFENIKEAGIVPQRERWTRFYQIQAVQIYLEQSENKKILVYLLQDLDRI
jgi:hypothetical protein